MIGFISESGVILIEDRIIYLIQNKSMSLDLPKSYCPEGLSKISSRRFRDICQ